MAEVALDQYRLHEILLNKKANGMWSVILSRVPINMSVLLNVIFQESPWRRATVKYFFEYGKIC